MVNQISSWSSTLLLLDVKLSFSCQRTSKVLLIEDKLDEKIKNTPNFSKSQVMIGQPVGYLQSDQGVYPETAKTNDKGFE